VFTIIVMLAAFWAAFFLLGIAELGGFLRGGMRDDSGDGSASDGG